MYSWKTRMAKTAAAVLAGTLALSGCGVGTGTTNAKGGPSVADTITAQVAYSSRDFNPLSTSMALPMAGNWHVTEALYTLQMSDYSLVSGLAAGEPEKISDTEYVITIRDGAKFSDGNAVTANDVKTSFERVMAPGGVYAPMLSFIDSITAQGDNKIDFKLKYAFTLFKERMSLVHIVPASQSDADLKKMPIGSGPWKYVEITDQQVKFDKNEYYNGEFPAQVSHMVWNVNVDDTARVTAMQNGKSDIMENVPAKAFDTLKAAGADIQTVDGFNQAFIMFNTKQKPFDDKRVRQAIRYGINHEEIIASRGNVDYALGGPIPSVDPGYEDLTDLYPYDVNKAKELMAEAGYSTDNPLKLTLTYANTYGTELGDQLRSQLAKIGIDLSINYVEFSTWLQDVHANGDYELSLVDHAESHDFYKWTTPDYYFHYDGKQAQELYAKALAATDEESSANYLKQAAKAVSEDAPADWLFGYRVTVAYHKNVQGFPSKLSQTVLPLWQITKAR